MNILIWAGNIEQIVQADFRTYHITIPIISCRTRNKASSVDDRKFPSSDKGDVLQVWRVRT